MIIKQEFIEDSYKRVFVGWFMPKRIIVTGISKIDCIPIGTRFLILKDGAKPLPLDLNYTTTFYNKTSSETTIYLPRWYVPDPISTCKEFGFDEIQKAEFEM